MLLAVHVRSVVPHGGCGLDCVLLWNCESPHVEIESNGRIFNNSYAYSSIFRSVIIMIIPYLYACSLLIMSTLHDLNKIYLNFTSLMRNLSYIDMFMSSHASTFVDLWCREACCHRCMPASSTAWSRGFWCSSGFGTP